MSSRGDDPHLHLVTSANDLGSMMILYTFAMAVCRPWAGVWIYHTITLNSHYAATIAVPDRYPTD